MANVNRSLIAELRKTLFPARGCLTALSSFTGGLQEGMIVTVEPGIYFSQYALSRVYLPDPVHGKYINSAVLAKYLPVGGVRIEDDILVTSNGYENLTTAPKGDEALKIIRGEEDQHILSHVVPDGAIPRTEIKNPRSDFKEAEAKCLTEIKFLERSLSQEISSWVPRTAAPFSTKSTNEATASLEAKIVSPTERDSPSHGLTTRSNGLKIPETALSPLPGSLLAQSELRTIPRIFETSAASYESHCENSSKHPPIPERKPRLPVKPLAYRHSMPLLPRQTSGPASQTFKVDLMSPRNVGSSQIARCVPNYSNGWQSALTLFKNGPPANRYDHPRGRRNLPPPTGVNYWMQPTCQIHRMLPEWRTRYAELASERFATELILDKYGLERWIRNLTSLDWEIRLVLAIEQRNSKLHNGEEYHGLEWQARFIALEVQDCISRSYTRYARFMQLPLAWRLSEPLVQKMEPVWRRRMAEIMAPQSDTKLAQLQFTSRLRTMRSIEAEIVHTVNNEPESGKRELDYGVQLMLFELSGKVRVTEANIQGKGTTPTFPYPTSYEDRLSDSRQEGHRAELELEIGHLNASPCVPSYPTNSDIRFTTNNVPSSRYATCISFATAMITELSIHPPNQYKVTADEILKIVMKGTCWAGLCRVLISRGIILPYKPKEADGGGPDNEEEGLKYLSKRGTLANSTGKMLQDMEMGMTGASAELMYKSGPTSGSISPWISRGRRFMRLGNQPIFWLGDRAVETECRICPVCLEVLFCSEEKRRTPASIRVRRDALGRQDCTTATPSPYVPPLQHSRSTPRIRVLHNMPTLPANHNPSNPDTCEEYKYHFHGASYGTQNTTTLPWSGPAVGFTRNEDYQQLSLSGNAVQPYETPNSNLIDI
jgi:hypothetical protein